MKLKVFLAVVLAICVCVPVCAEEYYMRKDDVWVAKDFEFHTGEVFPELKLGYVTLGNPENPAVLILHGTNGSGAAMLNKNFGEQLFLEGQPLDARKYYIILTDALGAGKSSKPSDGLKAKFPNYNYDDMVHAQYRLVTEGLGVKHLRVIIGNSMGGMQTWLWSIYYPDFMDAAVPMASMPMAMSGRNWMMRKFISYTVRNDPAWNNGDYTEQPFSAKYANVFYAIATNGGNMALWKAAPTSKEGDEIVAKRLAADFKSDANDFLYQWESSREYNPQGVEKIKAYVLAINSADDERNPAEFGVMEREIAKIEHAEYYLIPGSAETAGHGTTAQAKWWKDKFVEFMKGVPEKK